MSDFFINRHHLIRLCLPALFLLSFLQGAQAQQREVLDRVVAIVDEGVILQSEYDARLNEIRLQAQQAGQQLPPMEALQEQIMEALVVESLQLQLADRMGIRFDDDTVNRVFQTLAEAAGLSFDEYVAQLQASGRYLSTREQIRKELALREIQGGMVNRRINITDQEIENFLNSESGRVTMAPDYLVDQILIPVAETDPAQVATAKEQFARDLYNRLQQGADFATLRMNAEQAARANPPQGFMVSGGELGWRKADQLPSLFADIVPDMATGEVHEPIRSSNGWHLLKLVNVQGDSNRLVTQTHVRHILITPNEIRTEEQARELIGDIHTRITEGGEDFALLARQFSDDTASVVAGGDLDWVNEGGVAPDFQAQIDALEPGEISEPFRTEFGWHIAEVIDRREQDLSQDFRRRQAENALRNRKFDIELENWLIEIREQAYVKVLI